MANTFDSHVWTLDTAGAIATYPVKVRKFIWKPSAAGQSLAIDEADGGEIWTATSTAAHPAGEQELSFEDGMSGMWFDGITLTTLTAGGALYVYLA